MVDGRTVTVDGSGHTMVTRVAPELDARLQVRMHSQAHVAQLRAAQR